MLILDGISQIEKGRLEVPFYHRGHISLKSHTAVNLVLIPPRPGPTGVPRLAEMVVSPIDFRSWPSVWRIEADFLEARGVVNKLLKIVAGDGLNVLNEESSSIENRDFHRVELLVDSQARASYDKDEDQDPRRMAELQRRIIALCIENLKLEGGSQRLRVKPMKGLRNAWRSFEECRHDRNANGPVRWASSIVKGVIDLPPSILECVGVEQSRRCILVSDTKERLLRVFFPDSADGFTYVRLAHHDSVGALELITEQLAKAFDIVNSLTRIQRSGVHNDFDLLLYSGEYSRPDQESARRTLLASLLSHQSLTSLNLRISYPRSAGSSDAPGELPTSMGPAVVVPTTRVSLLDDKLAQLDTATVLKRRVADYERSLAREPSLEKRKQLQARLKILRDSQSADKDQTPHLRIFVSYEFTRNDLFKAVTTTLKRRGCTIVTGEKADEGRATFRDVIVDRIGQCDAFLGVWTVAAQGFSPWLLWEVGVAQAKARPFRLLTQESIPSDLWQRIYPERQHYSFKDVEFPEVCKEAVGNLIDEVARLREGARGN